MNDKLRKQLALIIEGVEAVKRDVEDVKSSEEESLENLPEAMQEGEKGEKFQETISNLEDCICYLDDAISSLQSVQ